MPTFAEAISPSTAVSTQDAKRVLAPRCPTCAARMQLRWVDVSSTRDAEPRWQLDVARCLTAGCETAIRP